MDFSGGLVVKSVPAKQEMCIQSRGQEDLLEKEMATHSIILAWEIHEQRSLAGKVHGITRVGHDIVSDQPTNTHTHTLSDSLSLVDTLGTSLPARASAHYHPPLALSPLARSLRFLTDALTQTVLLITF